MNVPDGRTHPGGLASDLLSADGRRRPFVLTINGGSSSLKFAVFAADSVARVVSGRVERVGRPGSRLIVADAEGTRTEDRAVEAPDQAAAAGLVIERVGRSP